MSWYEYDMLVARCSIGERCEKPGYWNEDTCTCEQIWQCHEVSTGLQSVEPALEVPKFSRTPEVERTRDLFVL